MVKCVQCYNIIDMDKYNIKLTKQNNRYLLGLVILLLLILLFIKNYNNIQSRILVFMTIFIMTVIISKNLLISILITLIIFLLINLLINYKSTLEKFQNEKDEKDIKEVASNEPLFDKNIFDTDIFKKSTANIQDLLKTVNGGIELKDDDLKETGKLNIDTNKYSDDKKPNVLKQAQKEAYELIDTVNALKDTVNTLAPVLSEGKKLMDIFQNLKL